MLLCPFVLLQFVAKRYKKPVERAVYFADAVLQMDAKFLGKLYDKLYDIIYYIIYYNCIMLSLYDVLSACWDGHQGVG